MLWYEICAAPSNEPFSRGTTTCVALIADDLVPASVFVREIWEQSARPQETSSASSPTSFVTTREYSSGLSRSRSGRWSCLNASFRASSKSDRLSTIEDFGGDPVSFSDEDFDFTAGGQFDPFNDYPTFLLLSQAFEDTGVRAYKGQAPKMAGNDLLTAALQIHSVEACHAGEDNATQAGVDQQTLGDYSAAEVTEAYDEPLTMEAVAGENGIATPFFA